MLKSAIAGGADAVYLGLDRFNARNSADNFNKDNFAEVISYAHIRGVLVYVTFNTIIKESEFIEATKYVDYIIESGADAIILQDFGIMSYVRKCFPSFPIHVSTQAGICNLNGVKLVERLGAKRVVLARETSIEEIKRIKDNTNIEIEYFVQGALCVCYSGNCYFSSIIDGNSGNRGMCKQPCRKIMNLIGDNFEVDGYNLSTFDTSLIDEIDKVISAGVYSLKIEGRMRSSEYVYYACKTYKEALQKLNYKEDFDKLKTTFNRGEYSHAYFDNRNNNVIYNKTQNNIGLYIGKVIAIKGEKAVVSTDYKPNFSDGFKVLRDDIEIGGAIFNKNCNYLIGKIEIVGKNIKVGDEIRLTSSISLKKEVESLDKKVTIDVKYQISINNVNISAEINGKAFSFNDFLPPMAANTLPLTKEEFEKQFNRFNDTPFFCNSISGEISGSVFYPKSAINAIRRDFVDRLIESHLKEQFIYYYKKEVINYSIGKKDYKVKNVVILSEYNPNLECNKEYVLVYRPLDYKMAYKDITSFDYLYIPNYFDSYDEVVLQNLIDKNNLVGLYCDGYNGVELALKNNLKFILGTNCNICNYSNLLIFDCDGFVNSKEIKLSERLKGGMVLSKGEFAIMTLVHCPLINSNTSSCGNCKFNSIKYVDQSNREFSVKRNKISGCLFTLLNNSYISCDEVDNNLYDFSHLEKNEIKKLLENDSSSVTNKGNLFRGIK